MLLGDTEQHKVMTESDWQNGNQFPSVVGFPHDIVPWSLWLIRASVTGRGEIC